MLCQFSYQSSYLQLYERYLKEIKTTSFFLIYKSIIGKFRREFRNVLGRGRCIKIKKNDKHKQWQSQYRSRHINEDQSFIQSTTHMLHFSSSFKRTLPVTKKTYLLLFFLN